MFNPFAHYVSIIANKIYLKQETCPCIHSGHQSTQVRVGGCAFFVRTLSKETLGYQIVIGNVSMSSPNCKIVINAIFSSVQIRTFMIFYQCQSHLDEKSNIFSAYACLIFRYDPCSDCTVQTCSSIPQTNNPHCE